MDINLWIREENVLRISCLNVKYKSNVKGMKPVLYAIFLIAVLSTKVVAQDASNFPKGEKAPNVNHVGNVWLHELSELDSVFNYGITVATFDPDVNARLNWHSHPGRQILMITAGIGYYQEKGKAKQTVRKGDIVKCAPGVVHWHGASPKSGVTYLATSPAQNGKTIWFYRVTDQEYDSK